MSKNRLIIYAANGCTVRETWFNVLDFKPLPNGFFSYAIGVDTKCSTRPTEKPLPLGDPKISSDSYIIGRVHHSNCPCDYSEDP